MQRNHRDRPGVRLTTEERRRFAEIAFQLRYELDGLTFPDLADDHHRPEGRRTPRRGNLAGRAARRTTRFVLGLPRRVATPFVLTLIGLGAVIGAAMSTGDLRFALTTTASFVLAWAATMAALQFARHRYARRAESRRRQHQISG